PSPPEAAESRLTVPLEAQEASYLAASERIANRSLSDFFIRCSLNVLDGEIKKKRCVSTQLSFKSRHFCASRKASIRILWKLRVPICYKRRTMIVTRFRSSPSGPVFFCVCANCGCGERRTKKWLIRYR